MTARWWSDPDAGDIVPAGPGSVSARLLHGDETLSADVAARLTAADGPGDTVALLELAATNVEGGRPSRSILAELTRLDCVVVAVALLAAAGPVNVQHGGARVVDDLALLVEAAGERADNLTENVEDGWVTGPDGRDFADRAARINAAAARLEAVLTAAAGRP